jgi:hypothetical protein
MAGYLLRPAPGSNVMAGYLLRPAPGSNVMAGYLLRPAPGSNVMAGYLLRIQRQEGSGDDVSDGCAWALAAEACD